MSGQGLFESSYFPFGQPNTPREVRRAGNCVGFVLGVYPSAFHISWWAPESWTERDLKRPWVGALAVDVEPEVFWDGPSGQGARDGLVAAWSERVGFTELHGRATWAANNGTSGRTLLESHLTPLGLDWSNTSATDAVNTFFVKRDEQSQGWAIDRKYNDFVDRLGREPSHLPPRPSPKGLVTLAVTKHRSRLRAALLDEKPQVILTVGQEALDTLLGVVDKVPTAPGQLRLERSPSYGKPGRVRVDGLECAWYPLAHPGALRGGPDAPEDSWAACHRSWKAGVRPWA